MLLDHAITCFALGILEAPSIIIRIFSMAHQAGVAHRAGIVQAGEMLPVFPIFNWYDVFVFSLYFNKDIFLGQSIGKRILNFRVVDDKTGEPAGALRCLVRNFTILLWPVEVIAALINVERRIGDHIAGTRLALYDPALQARPNWLRMAVAIVVGMLFTFGAWFYPFELLMRFLVHRA